MASHDAFLPLFLAARQDLGAFIGTIFRDPLIRDDVFQQVAVILEKKIKHYDPARSFGAWARWLAARKIMEDPRHLAHLPATCTPETLEALSVGFAKDEAEAMWQDREKALDHGLHLLLPEADLSETALKEAAGRVRGQLRDGMQFRLGLPAPPCAAGDGFTSLVSAWLDGSATAEAADQLWQAVRDRPECAHEFAATARFEALLAVALQRRDGSDAKTSPQEEKRRTSRLALPLAAALALVGIAAWLLWPVPAVSRMAQTSPANSRDIASTSRAQTLPAEPQVQINPPPIKAPLPPERELPERLERFFLPSLALDNVPLNGALGILQGYLQELNFLNAKVLEKVHITVPTAAAGRRITFHSGPIAFLKAVRAVAALGGCDVTIEGPALVLTLRRETFPQPQERRNLRALLAGRFNKDGSAAADNPAHLAALLADAAALGIPIDPSRPLEAQSWPLLTRGQWEALQELTHSREQLNLFPAPSYDLYITEGSVNPTNGVIGEQEVAQIEANLEPIASVPAVIAEPPPEPVPEEGAATLAAVPQAAPDSPPPANVSQVPAGQPVIFVQPWGEGRKVTVSWSSIAARYSLETVELGQSRRSEAVLTSSQMTGLEASFRQSEVGSSINGAGAEVRALLIESGDSGATNPAP
ncbi:MAG: sigma-70 family RNA polymerase sigma factor [Prosthecobacter sp.]|nr:sigma-70 family RNA polymerase sigma factor [Prosthecobacter sp.]